MVIVVVISIINIIIIVGLATTAAAQRQQLERRCTDIFSRRLRLSRGASPRRHVIYTATAGQVRETSV